ncbi:MAG: hypothetical protein KKD18_02235 [Nanoarchaeota archaeon]|nr:hypothetical protein [Nanoarchaeota archaeon]
MWFLAIPGIMYIIALVLGVLAVAFSTVIFGWMQITFTKMILMGAGMYILLKFTLPQIIKTSVDNKTAIFLVVLTLLLIGLGLPGYGLSILGGL